MMNKLILIALLFSAFSCKSQKPASDIDYEKEIMRFANTISEEEITEMSYTYASDEFKGREAASEFEYISTEYIRNFYKENDIAAAPNTNDYYQLIPKGTYSRLKGDCNNVAAYIPGTDKADEVIVLTAHLDHLGVKGSKVFNGADDNGSGTIAIMNIAKAFKRAVDKGFSPRRTIVFLHVTGEEKGLYGSAYYADNPLLPMEKTITNLNMDMIGRVDDEHKDDENYLYLIGSEVLSKDLKAISERVNNKYFNINFDYRFDAPDDPNRFYYRSDHYNFAKHNVPVIFYFNGIHDDYHKHTDTPEKLNYPLLTKRTKLIFATTWAIANADEKPKLND